MNHQQLSTQLWISDVAQIRPEVVPVINDEESAFIKKPRWGTGLWTSTWREETQDSSWIDYWQEYGNPSECYWHLLTPRSDSNLYIIDTNASLEYLIEKYAWETDLIKRMNTAYAAIGGMTPDPLDIYTRKSPYFFALDFEKISKDFDGIWLTDEGISATRLPLFYEHDLHSWSCESTLWFRWCFEQVEMIRQPIQVAR